MGANSGIEWTNATWNPWHGCHKVSPGCKHCYMFREKKRYGQEPNVVVRSKTTFDAPLKWPKVQQFCFTCSWSDFFIEEADPWREEAYAVMRATPWITYQVLTKRIDRIGLMPNPNLSNMWLGVSVENADYKSRIDILKCIQAPLRFLSLEPLLGDLGELNLDGIGWVIVGGESGPDARPMHPDWARSIQEQCTAAKVPFFFKQWGEWRPRQSGDPNDQPMVRLTSAGRDGQDLANAGDGGDVWMQRAGKDKAGRLLDGREWNEFPERKAAA